VTLKTGKGGAVEVEMAVSDVDSGNKGIDIGKDVTVLNIESFPTAGEVLELLEDSLEFGDRFSIFPLELNEIVCFWDFTKTLLL
jgi:hypothetical protein